MRFLDPGLPRFARTEMMRPHHPMSRASMTLNARPRGRATKTVRLRAAVIATGPGLAMAVSFIGVAAAEYPIV